jgi:3',5'-cyclic-AMP phosphodiesterase
MKFIHLTDLHLVPSGRRLYGLDPNARLRAAVADINACHGDAEFVLITGDLVHDGEPAAYDAVRRALDQLAVPRHLLIGNHDDRAVFKALFPEAVTDEHGFVQTVVESSAGPFVLSTRMSRVRIKAGSATSGWRGSIERWLRCAGVMSSLPCITPHSC